MQIIIIRFRKRALYWTVLMASMLKRNEGRKLFIVRDIFIKENIWLNKRFTIKILLALRLTIKIKI